MVTKSQEELIRDFIARHRVVYSTQLAALAKLTKGADWNKALKAIQMQLYRGGLKGYKPPCVHIWHIDVEAAFAWLEKYNPGGNDDGYQDPE